MTKDEIKKALECCEKYAYCKDCPCYTYCDHGLHKGALALITEQEQIIENLNGLIDYADKEIRKLKADNQELTTAHCRHLTKNNQKCQVYHTLPM